MPVRKPAGGLQKIVALQPGTWFTYPELGRTAQLLRLGPSGAVIKFTDEYTPVRVSDFSDVLAVSHGALCERGIQCEIPQAEP